MKFTKRDQLGKASKPRSKFSRELHPKKPIARMSAKRVRLNRRVYAPMVKQARGDGRQPCQILSPACTGYVQHLHEPLTRARAGGLEASLRDGPQPIPCCDHCNSWVSENPVRARELGLLVSRKVA